MTAGVMNLGTTAVTEVGWVSRLRGVAQQRLIGAAKTVLPDAVQDWLRNRRAAWAVRPAVGGVRMGGLRRVTPISRSFGFDRGQPIDRYYIERFLNEHQADIHGRVLEVGDAYYTCRFGGDRVVRSDVLHAVTGNGGATIVGDLSTGRGLPEGVFDCAILTQVLPFIFDVRGAVQGCWRSLRPGGVVLATVGGISQISRHDMDRWGDYWRFTSLSVSRLFGRVFGDDRVAVTTYGNVLSATGLLYGLAAEEFSAAELDHRDRDYEVLIAVRAVRKL